MMKSVFVLALIVCSVATFEIGSQEHAEQYNKLKRFLVGETFEEHVRLVGDAASDAALDDLIKKQVGKKPQVEAEMKKQGAVDPKIAKVYQNGLSKFSMSQHITMVKGISLNMLGEYITYVINDELRIPAPKNKEVRATLTDLEYMDNAKWTDMSVLYNDKNAGAASYLNILGAISGANTVDVLHVQVGGAFTLHDDILVTTSMSTGFLGLFGKTKVKITRRPATLTKEALDLLFQYFSIGAFERFKSYRRI
eukprot:TRINITY_DN43883_c0_g1_i1.p1 TRINITY_DN43883_c0_g1~~TRINITY_DN43883_c0_g1_i1.p1  ORF type:complete len:252 (+),score=52.33 TRINITY_DN43883_c0_g1_i1:1-756(+)